MASAAQAAAVARRRVQTRQVSGQIALYSACVVLALVTVFPFVWMVSTSFKVPGDELVWPPQWIPRPFTTENYTELFSRSMARNFPFTAFIWHSTYIALLNVVGRVIVCALGGYAFARLRFPGSKYAFGMLIASLLLPDIVSVIPLYGFYNQIGWLDTHWPLIMPGIFANTFGTFLFRQFFMTLPQELDDAARIDGAGHFRIFFSIALPLARPVMAALAIFTFQGSWNNVQTPVFYITSLRNQTLPVGLLAFNQQYGVQYSLLMAGSMLALVPVLLVFIFFQRYFVQGIQLTGLKG